MWIIAGDKHFLLSLLFEFVCVWSAHICFCTSVHERNTIQPEPVTVAHTLSSSLSALHSVKTNVYTDRPSFHPSTRRRRRRCPSSTTLPASQHTTKTKTPRQAQQCVMCLAHNTLILPGPRLSSTLPQACSSFGSPPDWRMGMASTQTCVVVTHHWRWYLLLLLELVHGSPCMLVVAEQVVRMNCSWTAIAHTYVHTQCRFIQSVSVHSVLHNLLWKVMICLG